MVEKKFLYCYKMTHDTGFAPNPYYEVLTLATCKPTIRRCAEIGYWISDWATGYKSQASKNQVLAIFVLVNRTTIAPRISMNFFYDMQHNE